MRGTACNLGQCVPVCPRARLTVRVLRHLQRCEPVLSNGNNSAPGDFSEQNVLSMLNCIRSADPDKMRALAERVLKEMELGAVAWDRCSSCRLSGVELFCFLLQPTGMQVQMDIGSDAVQEQRPVTPTP